MNLNMRYSRTILCGAIIVGGLSTLPANAVPSVCDAIAGNLVTNCGFETGTIAGWTHTGNTGGFSVDTGAFYVHSGTYGVLEGPVGSDGFLNQTLSTTAGNSYNISAWYDPSGGTPADFDIEWNGVILVDLINASTGWQDVTATAIGTGSDVLSISFRDDPAFGGIDDVSVVAAVARVPEPATIALFGAGLAGLGALRRRRKAKALAE